MKWCEKSFLILILVGVVRLTFWRCLEWKAKDPDVFVWWDGIESGIDNGGDDVI